jgi:hypothetical protein
MGDVVQEEECKDVVPTRRTANDIGSLLFCRLGRGV